MISSNESGSGLYISNNNESPPYTPPQSPQLILRDPHRLHNQRVLPLVPAQTQAVSQNGLTELISNTVIPKLGSIVKRFSLNYSGEGLVTDRQRTRTVRVGIRFQVQLDSFQNPPPNPPPQILRSHSAPQVEYLDSGFISPAESLPRLLPIESSGDRRQPVDISIGSEDPSPHSSGVSSQSSSPTLIRRGNQNSLQFHNRINQALTSYQDRTRRTSVQVYRRESDASSSDASTEHINQSMEDSSSYQMLRHVPGSNVNSLNELSWETAAFEKEIRDRLQWIGDKVSTHRVPRILGQLFGLGRDYARENPLTAFILLCLCLTSSAPVLVFLVFAVATILVTFLGFLFVEGTLLTGATVIFGGVIVIVGFITLSGVLLGMLGYFTTTQAYLVITGQSQIFKILRKLPLIGRLFPAPKAKLESNGVVRNNGHCTNGYAQRYYVEEVDDDNDSEA